MAQFWGFECKNCGDWFSVAEIVEPDVIPLSWNDPTYRQELRCPNCLKWNTYSSGDFEEGIGPDPDAPEFYRR